MKTSLSLLLIFTYGVSSAQRILYTSRDLNRTDTTRAIDAIRPHWFAGQFATNITVIHKNGVKQKISRDSIWGFEDRDHSVYRSYQGDLYRMNQADDLLMYMNATSHYRFIRYSRTLDSPLYGTKRKARKDTVVNQ